MAGNKPGPVGLDRAEIVPKILQSVASGISLDKTLTAEGMPSPSTFWRWHMEDQEIRDNLARARENGVEARLEECVDISDTAIDRDSAAAAKVRIDTRVKMAQMMAPRKYKPGIDVTSGGEKLGMPDAVQAARDRALHGE